MGQFTKYLKPILGTTIGLGVIVSPIVYSLVKSVNSFKLNPKRYVIANAASIKTLNPFSLALGEANVMEPLYNAALTKTLPTTDNQGGIGTILSLPKLGFMPSHGPMGMPSDWAKKSKEEPEEFKELLKKGGKLNPAAGTGYNYSGMTWDLAKNYTPIEIQVGSYKQTRAVKFDLQNTNFWNGDVLSAEDMLETIKRAIDVKSACPWAYFVTDVLRITNAKKIYDAQIQDGLSFEDALKKFPLGVYVASEIPENEWSNLKNKSAREKAIKWYKDRGLKRHSSIIYTSSSDMSSFIVKISRGVICAPTNVRFMKNIGFDKYGRGVNSIMGLGPFKPQYANLDYRIISDRWDGYWDRERVISPQVEMRIVADTTTQLQLFMSKQLSTVNFGSTLLPIFNSDPELKRLVKPSKYADGTTYLRFNLNPSRDNHKYLKDVDFRRAVMYSMDREGYQLSSGADRSFPGETWSADAAMGSPLGESVRSIIEGTSVYKYAKATPTNFELKHNDLTEYGQNLKIINRSSYETTSESKFKKNKVDYLFKPKLAKKAWASFRAKHPEAPKEIELTLLISTASADPILAIKQSIENTLDGIKVKLLPKPQQTASQESYKLKSFDLYLSSWSPDYNDPWTYYHLLADKVGAINKERDPAAKISYNRNTNGPYSSLVDYIIEQLNKDPDYFKNNLFIDNAELAQFLRLVTTAASDDPSKINKSYDKSIWTRPWNQEGNRGYGGIINEADALKMQKFIEDNSTKDEWKNTLWRFHHSYVVAEKLIRDSAYGLVITHLSNKYVASRSIGYLKYGFMDSFSFAYNVDNIPNSTLDLPGIEAIAR